MNQQILITQTPSQHQESSQKFFNPHHQHSYHHSNNSHHHRNQHYNNSINNNNNNNHHGVRNKYYNNSNNNNNNNNLKYQNGNQQQQYQYHNPHHHNYNNNHQNMIDFNNNTNYQIANDATLLRDKLNKLNLSTNTDSSNKSNRIITPTSPNNNNSTQFNYDNKAILSPTSSSSSSSSPTTVMPPTKFESNITTSTNQPVWKSLMYDPNTSIYLIKREKLDRRFLFNSKYMNEIAAKTKTKISYHASGDINENNTTIYFTVTGTYDSRCNALDMLRDETDRAGVIVNLPSLLNADETTRRPLKSNLTRNIPTATQTVKKQCSFATDDLNSDNRITKKISFDTTAHQITINTNKPGMNVKRTKSFHNRFDLASPDEEKFINVTNTPEPALNRTNSQSSSVTSTSSSSTTSPISHSSSNSATQPKAPKKRYTFEFLLQRADDVQSKQLPKDWPELNLKYPNICFCGRVISYFNPQKYQAYWNQIKQVNQHLHV